MKNKLFVIIVGAFLILNAGCKKSTDEEIASLSSPKTETNIKLEGELPSKESIPELFDEMDFQQATQCYLWGLPIVAFAEWQQDHYNKFNATSNDLVFYNTYNDRLGILTANATTPYIMSFIDLAKNGPTVIEMPAGHTAGGLGDFWQREQAVIGEMGPDKGKGGKYILVPPTMKDFKPAGYFIVPCNTMNMFFGFRVLDPDPKATETLVKQVKIYPYDKRANPVPTKIVSPPAGKKWYAVQPKGIAYWERLNAILQEEPVDDRDRFFMAWLKNLGIEKGKSFNPDERQKKILIAAAEKGEQMAIANSFCKRFKDVKHWPDKKWDYVMIIKDPSQHADNYDEFFERTSYFYEAVTYSKAMISKTPNVGQAYLGSYFDNTGNWLDGAKNYTLNVPANPPAVNFWSITVYDAATRCLIDNAQQNADLSSRKDLIKNTDGSVDLYFGPKAPQGKEKNWVQTLPGKHWFTYMRFYGPTTAYFDKSWKMDDIKEVK
ncbi:DUF1254 domain-containing protein [Flavobacterium sp. MC2016-06]|uniref:DUF1254 domain-containing protein n=1 Tax=Flavobacterium sp. MC2016-06 TaxID=2676308 RepID=UPI0012BAFAB1|nr:DUF1254 domain-containing protein [Flavobacterium sp. MC2016-06]MBU3859113.1 DUF1254 domain-containing protein [Flavobacterium sp. MC2016-06]